MKDVKIQLEEDKTDIICEKCGRTMVVKVGRYGKFIACPGYPECKNVKKFVKPTPGLCPKCGNKIIEKRTKTKKIFYSCEKYPECDFSTWDMPVEDTCPNCGRTLFRRKGRNSGLYCLGDGCGYKQEKRKE